MSLSMNALAEYCTIGYTALLLYYLYYVIILL